MSLSVYLLRWIAASGALALAVAAAWIVVDSARDATREHARVAATVQRLLALQATGPAQGAGLAPRFFDWGPVSQVTRPAGSCVELVAASGRVLRRSCRGWPAGLHAAPTPFAALYGMLAAASANVVRPLHGAPGELAVAVRADSGIGAARAWRRMQAVVWPMGAAIVLTCLAVWLAAARALRPLGEIVTTLERIGQGDYAAGRVTSGCAELGRLHDACTGLAAALTRAGNERTALVRRLVAVQEQERAALALELHDEFGQHLSVIRANAAGMLSAPNPAEAALDVARIERSAAHLARLVRERLRALRPWSGDFVLVDALGELAADVGGGGRPTVVLELEGLDSVPRALAITVFRIVQESLTNALRHAAARTVSIDVRPRADTLVVSVSDDGRGGDPRLLTRGTGLTGIEERARAAGGRAELLGNAAGGLTVRVTLPARATPPGAVVPA